MVLLFQGIRTLLRLLIHIAVCIPSKKDVLIHRPTHIAFDYAYFIIPLPVLGIIKSLKIYMRERPGGISLIDFFFFFFF